MLAGHILGGMERGDPGADFSTYMCSDLICPGKGRLFTGHRFVACFCSLQIR